MNRSLDAEPQLGPGFSTRVLAAADDVLARRRRLRRAAGVFVVCVGIALAAGWRGFTAPPQRPSQAESPMLASVSPTGAAPRAETADRDTSAEALSWFFPDAQSLARYDAEDASDDTTNSAGALFADDD